MSRARTGSAILIVGWLLLAAGCGDLRAPAGDSAESGVSSSPNVVLVVLDAARADHFGAYGYTRPTTPHADAFAATAVRYARVMSEASYTFLSTSSLFAGASPAATGLGARTGGRVPGAVELLAEIAREHGYATVAYSENPYVTGYFGLDQGFDVFREAWPTDALASGQEIAPDLDTEAEIESALREAAGDASRPFLLYLHLLRPHNPYAPPLPFAGRFGSTEADRPRGSTSSLMAMDAQGPGFEPGAIAKIRTLYDENLAYADALFGALIDALEARGLRDDTIVVLTSDHGEAFGEHGRLLHATQLYDAMLHVPLLVHVPGEDADVVTTPIQLADLGRGLRRVVEGGPAVALTRLGEERDPERPLYSWTNGKTGQIAAWTPERRVILDMRSRETIAYYDLEVDPDSRSRVALDAAGEALAAAANRQVDAWTGRAPTGSAATAAEPLDPLKRAQLEALGYLDP